MLVLIEGQQYLPFNSEGRHALQTKLTPPQQSILMWFINDFHWHGCSYDALFSYIAIEKLIQ